MARLKRFGIGWALLAIVVAALPLYADGSLFGTISGRVKDESGGALPGTTVELTSDEKGFKRQAVTDDSGAFTFALLPPGKYTVRAFLSGFESVVSTGNVVLPEKTTNVAVQLKLAGAAESIEVAGDIPLVDKTNTVRHDRRALRADRQAADRPRATRPWSTSRPARTTSTATATSTRAARRTRRTSSCSTASTRRTRRPGPSARTTTSTRSRKSWSRTRTSRPSTAACRAPSSTSITKSGSNFFHGSGRALVTNDSWNDDNKGVSEISGEPWNRTKIDENSYNYSFTLGGPVLQDHLWFFGAYQRNPQAAAAGQTQTSTQHPDGTGQELLPDADLRGLAGQAHRADQRVAGADLLGAGGPVHAASSATTGAPRPTSGR